MESQRRPSAVFLPAQSARARFARTLTLRRDTKDTDTTGDSKGPLGLTCLHVPDGRRSVVDLIFVHGLNGGSVSTWTFGDEATHFWPGSWLPQDAAFQDVRIHTFGYSSGIGKESVLNITDFSKSLLSAIHDNPSIPRDEQAPIILVGHSMGGLVLKSAYILSCQTPEFQSISDRILALFFLGTPHQGADIAQTLYRLLSLAGARETRPFLSDLFPGSPIIRSVNEEFPTISTSLKLFSFFETKPMNYGVGKDLIVQRSSAVLNYPNERRTHLDANHRDVARYSSPNDPSYITVRNALATVIGTQRGDYRETHRETTAQQRSSVSIFLGVQGPPEEELMVHDSARLPGSCEWLLRKKGFERWQQEFYSKVYWLMGRPGVGKSVISSYAVTHFQGIGHDCCYFFFGQGERSRNTINSFLRSMAFQMASMHPNILEMIDSISSEAIWNEASIDKVDYQPIWRKIFLAGILKVRLSRTQYWFIDAVDECKNAEELLPLLARAQELWPLCIFATSRRSVDSYRGGSTTKLDVVMEHVSVEDTNSDIVRFLQSTVDTIFSDEGSRASLVNEILEKSNGCFLWASLVQKEIGLAHTATEIRRILSSMPSDMDAVYRRILEQMAESRQNKTLTQAILSWTVCSFRSLATDELHAAIEEDIQDEIVDVERIIDASCGGLIFVDKYKKIQLIHITARDLLTQDSLDSEFRVDSSRGHQRIALACLNHLIGSSAARRSSSPRVGRSTSTSFIHLEDSSLAQYASEYLFQHLARINSRVYDDEIFRALAKFLSLPSVLWWIENSAKHSDLQRVFRAGKIIATLVQKRTQRSPPLRIHKEISIAERWSSDLVNMVTKFGRRIRDCPSSIQQLVPAFCPPLSAIRRQFSSSMRGISVQGLSGRDWDDCLSTVNFEKPARPITIAAAGGHIAVGTSTGGVIMYDDDTFHETQVLSHGEPVWCLEFAESGELLASAGSKRIKVWNLETGSAVQSFQVQSLCLAMSFADEERVIYAALRNNTLICVDIGDGELLDEPVDWTRDFVDTSKSEISNRQPAAAVFCRHLNLLAIVYRQEDLIIWSIDDAQVFDIYQQGWGPTSQSSPFDIPNSLSPAADSDAGYALAAAATGSIYGIAFSLADDTHLLAVAYADGELAVYDLEDAGGGRPRATLSRVDVHVVASSHDGRTLATVDARGGIRLFDFATLKFLYHVQFDGSAPAARALAFTANNLRLVEVRGRQCRVWGPSVLLRHDADADDELSDTVSISTAPLEIDYNAAAVEVPAVTALCCAWMVPVVFCGKDDGTVHVHDMSGDGHTQLLFTRPAAPAIHSLHFDGMTGLLSCSDSSAHVVSRHVTKVGRARLPTWEVSDQLIDTRSNAAVSQIIGSGRHSRLLVSSHDCASLWKFSKDGVEGSLVRRIDTTQASMLGCWTAHPTNPDRLLFIGADTVDIFEWTTFELVSHLEVRSELVGGTVIAIRAAVQQSIICSVTESPAPTSDVGSSSSQNIQIWNADQFSSEGGTLVQPTYVLKATDIQFLQVLGILNNRLVFLNKDYWICSITVRSSPRAPESVASIVPLPRSSPQPRPTSQSSLLGFDGEERQVVRHFFLPHDWIGLVGQLHLEMSKSGDIFLSRQGEIVVVRKGLSMTPDLVVTAKTGRATSPGFKLPMRPPTRTTP